VFTFGNKTRDKKEKKSLPLVEWYSFNSFYTALGNNTTENPFGGVTFEFVFMVAFNR
jgi:hypothetical protein